MKNNMQSVPGKRFWLPVYRSVCEKFKIAPYMRERVFDVEYSVEVENRFNKARDFTVVVPIPPDTNKQELLLDPVFIPEKVLFKTDVTYQNHYGVWHGKFGANTSGLFSMNFKIRVKPYKAMRDVSVLQGVDVKADDVYLQPDVYIQSKDLMIKALADKLLDGKRGRLEKLQTIYDHIVAGLVYGNPVKGLYSSLDALKLENVDCGGFSTLFAALCRSAGIPARIASGFWVGFKNNEMHAWLECKLEDGSWMAIDPSIGQLAKRGRTLKSGGFGTVGSDRIVFSYGCDIPIELDGQTVNVDILQHPIITPVMNMAYTLKVRTKQKL